jgi:hypothetical protein
VNGFGIRCAAVAIVATIAGGILVSGQTARPEPRRQFGASITGAFEGWFYGDDGSRNFLVGYYNRNSQQEIDIPIGRTTASSPAGPTRGSRRTFSPAGNGACSPWPRRRSSRTPIATPGRLWRTARA